MAKDKMQRIREFVRISLEEDITDLRGVTVKEALLNVALGLLQLLIVAFHIVLSLWQLVVSVLLLGYDGLVKVLKKTMSGTGAH